MENKDKQLLHNLDTKPRVSTSLSTPIIIGIVVVAIVLGLATGFGVSSFTNISGSKTTNKEDTTKDSSKTSAGVLDKKTFTDKAEGTLREGGFEGEGNFHLERPGGEDQKAYLTSTAVDLSDFVGKKVRVWGQTYAAEKAGWLMDVGYVEVIK